MRTEDKRSSAENGSPVPRELVHASRKADIVSVPRRRCLAIDGIGSPYSAAFREAIGALFGVAHTLKVARKRAGAGDFKIGPLEGHWSVPDGQWHWRLRVGVPLEVTRDDVERVKREVVSRRGGKLHASPVVPHVFVESVAAERVGRILHVGPYADEDASFALIAIALDRAGLHPAPTHIEVYRSDPLRTHPAGIETVLLRELSA
jgi:hypothetical protein